MYLLLYSRCFWRYNLAVLIIFCCFILSSSRASVSRAPDGSALTSANTSVSPPSAIISISPPLVLKFDSTISYPFCIKKAAALRSPSLPTLQVVRLSIIVREDLIPSEPVPSTNLPEPGVPSFKLQASSFKLRASSFELQAHCSLLIAHSS